MGNLRMRSLALLILATLVLFLRTEFASSETMTLTVIADQTKNNGEPWDGLVGLGGGHGALWLPIPNSDAPPDLSICIVSISGNTTCIDRREGSKRYSLCQNSFDCTFEKIEITGHSFGVIILDIDLKRDDLVDFFIISERKDEKNVQILENLTTDQLQKLAPVLTDGERQRRKRKTLVFEYESCVGIIDTCRLIQSSVKITTTRGDNK